MQTCAVTLQVYQLENEKHVRIEIPALNGKIETIFTVLREGDMIHIQRQRSSKPWNVSSMGMKNVRNAEDSEFQIVHGSTLIKADSQTNELKIQLS
jgi:hypothetical protein